MSQQPLPRRKRPPRKTRVTAFLLPQILEQIEQWAEARDRTPSYIISELLTEAVVKASDQGVASKPDTAQPRPAPGPSSLTSSLLERQQGE